MLQNEQFHYSPYAFNGWGHVTDLTSVELHEKSEICKLFLPVALLLYESFILIFLRKIACKGSVAELRHFVTMRRFIYNAIGQ